MPVAQACPCFPNTCGPCNISTLHLCPSWNWSPRCWASARCRQPCQRGPCRRSEHKLLRGAGRCRGNTNTRGIISASGAAILLEPGHSCGISVPGLLSIGSTNQVALTANTEGPAILENYSPKSRSQRSLLPPEAPGCIAPIPAFLLTQPLLCVCVQISPLLLRTPVTGFRAGPSVSTTHLR